MNWAQKYNNCLKKERISRSMFDRTRVWIGYIKKSPR